MLRGLVFCAWNFESLRREEERLELQVRQISWLTKDQGSGLQRQRGGGTRVDERRESQRWPCDRKARLEAI